MSTSSIKLGVYYFDICNYNLSDLKESKEVDFRSNSVDDTSSSNHQNVKFPNNPKWIADDKQIENYLKLIEYNSLNNWSSNNRNNGLGVIPKTGVRSYQRNGKQQVHKMKPIIGIIVSTDRMHPQSVSKLNKMDLPVINVNQLPDYNGWSPESGGVSALGKRILNVYPAVQQLCKGKRMAKALDFHFIIYFYHFLLSYSSSPSFRCFQFSEKVELDIRRARLQ